ncbi:MocR-like pyridoxine biosynthesis transcription factor PdxR [Longirhabdus pacifica]|uniref:MocR-like pyridoxine biosynthesis transcription factor PdxR n=1 Tax=Longirhabdus pacifica TaxID=2305227 RepID=UPI0013E89A26|nr:PLP-dependent aminotransferase family protein [Longirhabdus pacifica]
MLIQIEPNSKVAVSDQIYDQLSNKIRSKLLPAGEQLPSLRSLAKKLNVSFITVNKAYKKLEKEKLVYIKHGKGVFVGGKSSEKYEMDSPYDWQHNIAHSLVKKPFLLKLKPSRYPLSHSVVHHGLIPTAYIADQMDTMLQKNREILAIYSPIQGDDHLRHEISTYLYKQSRLKVDPQDMIITSGTQQAIEIITKTFIRYGDTVITQSPTYATSIDVFLNQGANVVSAASDEQGMILEQLEKLCIKLRPKLVYVNPTFQNPTGAVWSIERRMELIRLAEQYHFIIMEDDPTSEIYFDDVPPPPSIKRFDQSGHVIYLKGFSKILAPGVRTGVMVANGPILNLLLTAKTTMDLGTPFLLQKAILPFLSTKRMIDHLEKLRTALQLRRDRVQQIINQTLKVEFTYHTVSGGLNLWLALPEWLNTDELLHQTMQEGISFLPGSVCYPNEREYNHLRISFSILSEKDMDYAVQRLCELINEHASAKL